MTHKIPPSLEIISNEDRPFQSDLTSSAPRLTVREGGKWMSDALNQAETPTSSQDTTRLAFETVEATLRAENWFFETVRAELSKAAPLSDFPTVMGAKFWLIRRSLSS